ncbi:MAG: hypothetical protein JWO44_1873 [Bacteroidetes bacterium]|nr:hypothetical protein [Bacteroidota bacterium]
MSEAARLARRRQTQRRRETENDQREEERLSAKRGSGGTKSSEVRNEPQRSGEAEHFATCVEDEGSKAHDQREEERLSVKQGSGYFLLSIDCLLNAIRLNISRIRERTRLPYAASISDAERLVVRCVISCREMN